MTVAVVVTVLACLLWTAPASATFPGDNGKLAFERGRMYTVNPNGSALTPITPENWRAREPAWSPDGRLIAFQYSPATSSAPPGYGIWVMSGDGTGARRVTREPESVARNDNDPAWSPDGRRIAFVRGTDLLVMNADGRGGSTNLTSTFSGSVLDPEWSPRGDLIAFWDGGDIWVVGADGSPAPRLVTDFAGSHRYPSWSPDGTSIAYAGRGEVRRVNLDGSNDTVLTGGLREVWGVAWSPDGTRIAFINDPGTDISVQEELYVMNANGTGVARVGVDTSINLDWGVAATVPAPVLGKAVNAGVVKGRVLIGVPADASSAAAGTSQKGVRFVPLTESRQIPVGSFLNTRRGTVRLTSARNRAGATQSGTFTGGLFQVLQSRKRAAKGLTELRLKGSSFKSCQAGEASAARLSRRTIRRLRGRARGRYRTRGRHSAATVRGTTWTVEDRCDGTLTTVKRGKVAVRDFRRKKTIVLSRGKRYLATPRG